MEERGLDREVGEESDEERRERIEDWIRIIEEREKEMQKRERWERIGNSEYNEWYNKIKKEGVPEYLKKG